MYYNSPYNFSPIYGGTNATGKSYAPGQLDNTLSQGMGYIPVWGQIAALAAAGKKITSDMNSPFGDAGNKLLLPSIGEWQARPMQSFGNAVDPFGTAANAAGLPKAASVGLLGPGALFQGGK